MVSPFFVIVSQTIQREKIFLHFNFPSSDKLGKKNIFTLQTGLIFTKFSGIGSDREKKLVKPDQVRVEFGVIYIVPRPKPALIYIHVYLCMYNSYVYPYIFNRIKNRISSIIIMFFKFLLGLI